MRVEAVPSTVQFVDLAKQHAEVADEVSAGFREVLESTTFVGGAQVASFETAWATFTGAAHAVGVGSGTDALELALRAAGIQSGDEVVVPANSFVASAGAVVRAGGTPRFVDCEEHHLIDVDAAQDAVNDGARFILPVHLYGQMAAMDRLAELARSSGAVVVEDAAQAHGAEQRGRRPGSIGVLAGWSFYPGKNLGAYGEAGAITTDDDTVANRLLSLRNHGGVRRYEHDELGFNSRLDTLQAVVLSAKLKRLASWNEARRAAARRYEDMLGGIAGLRLPLVMEGNVPVWHLYVVRVEDRDRVIASLAQNGIQTGIHYPAPIHLVGAYRHLGHVRGDFPVAESMADEMLSLPMHPHLTGSDQERVAACLAAALR
jgi:dTDP-4-amino-4,6-dideoxygalactose transaminase